MGTQFLRQAKVTITAPGMAGKTFVSLFEDDLSTMGLRMLFRVDKTLEQNPNPTTLQVFNLAQSSKSLFEATDASVTIEAGYLGETKAIFTGNVIRAVHKKSRADWLTEVEAVDGGVAYQSATLDKSYAKGTPATTVLQDLVGALKGVANGGVSASSSVIPAVIKIFQQGFAATGSAQKTLDYVAGELGLEWSIQDGQVQFLQTGQPTLETAVVLSSETGLIGSPGRLRPRSPEDRNITGVEFSCLLNPALKPGRLVVLDSANLSGTYRVARLTHEGDTHGGAWITHCEAEQAA